MIKKFKKFVEAISGWELMDKDMGPNYPLQKLPNTINKTHTTTIIGIDNKFYTIDDYLDLYNKYLIMGNTPIKNNEFNKLNLDHVISSVESGS